MKKECKGNVYQGPRGGTYYLSGKAKVYCTPKKEVATPKKASKKVAGKAAKKVGKKAAKTTKRHESTIVKWTSLAVKSSDKEYDYVTIPKGTTLYKGVAATFEDNTVARQSFYAELDVAAAYGFNDNSHLGENGKVITFITTKDVRLVDISTRRSVTTLKKLAEKEDDEDFIDRLESAFGTPDRPNRSSIHGVDYQVGKWLCDHGIPGFGYTSFPGFHEEVMICDETALVRGDLEYRVIKNEQCIFEVSRTQGIIKALPPDVFAEYKLKTYGPEYKPTKGQVRATDKYIKQLRKDAHKLCEPVYKQYQDDYVQAVDMLKKGDTKGLSKLISTYRVSPYRLGVVTGEIDVSPTVMKFLVEAGADINIFTNLKSIDKKTLQYVLSYNVAPDKFVDIAARSRDVNLLKLLHEYGVKSSYIFIASVRAKFVEGANYALTLKGVDSSTIANELGNAIRYDDIDTINYLLSLKADPSPHLYTSVIWSKPDTVKLLLDSGAKLDDMFEKLINYPWELTNKNTIANMKIVFSYPIVKQYKAEIAKLKTSLNNYAAIHPKEDVTEATKILNSV